MLVRELQRAENPPTIRMIMINNNGVVGVNRAQAARKNELTTALMMRMLRKPKYGELAPPALS